MKRYRLPKFPLMLATGAALFAVALLHPASAATDDQTAVNAQLEEGDEALDYKEQAAQWYAEDHDVSVEEAKRRMRVRDDYIPVTNALDDVAPARQAGTWFEHEGEYRLVASFTGDEEGLEEAFEIAADAPHPVEIRTGAVRTEDELLEAMTAARESLSDEAAVGGSWVDVPGGAVKVTVEPGSPFAADTASFEEDLEANHGVPFYVDVQDEPTADNDAYAGGEVHTTDSFSCTSAFAVRDSQWNYGVMSAAHCGNGILDTFFDGMTPYNMTHMGAILGPSHDVNWGTVNTTVHPTIGPMSGANVVGQLTKAQQQINDQFCKYGQTTGYTCGYLVGKTYQPSGNGADCGGGSCDPTWMFVESAASDDGDSGGPWFRWTEGGNIRAAGVHKGGTYCPVQCSYYMASDYWSDLGLTILTWP